MALIDRFWLDPVPRGILLALFSVFAAGVGLCFFIAAMPPASPELLRSLATVAAALTIAYVVEAVWLSQRQQDSGELDGYEYEEWLGFLTGAGIAALLAIPVALLTAEHRATGHENLLDDLGTAYTVVSLAIVGLVIVIQPLLAHRFRAGGDSGPGAEADEE